MVARDCDDDVPGRPAYLSNRAVREATRLRELADLYDREMVAEAARVQRAAAKAARARPSRAKVAA